MFNKMTGMFIIHTINDSYRRRSERNRLCAKLSYGDRSPVRSSEVAWYGVDPDPLWCSHARFLAPV